MILLAEVDLKLFRYHASDRKAHITHVITSIHIGVDGISLDELKLYEWWLDLDTQVTCLKFDVIFSAKLVHQFPSFRTELLILIESIGRRDDKLHMVVEAIRHAAFEVVVNASKLPLGFCKHTVCISIFNIISG